MKSQRTASTFVFGTLLPNNELPHNPGANTDSDKGSSLTATANFENFPSTGCNRGQNGADFHSGTINVPSTLQAWACAITLGTRLTGGHHQLFSPLQSAVNASIASEPGFQHLLLKRGNCQLFQSANLSTVCGPHIESNSANIEGLRNQSS